MSEHHLHSLEFLVLWWDRTDFVCDLVSFNWDIFSLNVRHVHKNVLGARLRSDETMSLGAGELLTYPLVDRAGRRTSRRRVCSGSLGREGAG